MLDADDADDADELDVPMAWFQAEQLARDLIWPVKDPWQLDAFECNAAQAVLALTLLFTGMTDQPGELSHDQLELIRDLVAPGARWLDWCEDLLDGGYISASSVLELARRSFRWLLLVSPVSKEQPEQSPGAGCRAGLKLARLALTWALT
jgi:hypothetical protein